MEFVPFSLIGNKEIGEIVNVGDRGGKGGQKVFLGVKESGATASRRFDFGPVFDLFIASLSKNIGCLANNYFLSLVDLGGKTKQGVNEGGDIELEGVVG